MSWKFFHSLLQQYICLWTSLCLLRLGLNISHSAKRSFASKLDLCCFEIILRTAQRFHRYFASSLFCVHWWFYDCLTGNVFRFVQNDDDFRQRQAELAAVQKREAQKVHRRLSKDKKQPSVDDVRDQILSFVLRSCLCCMLKRQRHRGIHILRLMCLLPVV